MRYASLQMRDRDAASDAVQETLMGPFEARERFSATPSVRTCLTGMLKHKIIDHVRAQSREQPLAMGGGDDRSEVEAIADCFKRTTTGASPHRIGVIRTKPCKTRSSLPTLSNAPRAFRRRRRAPS